jgi:hypothetical protein
MLIKNFVADYCSNSNRPQEKTMPETVFLFCAGNQKKKLSASLHRSFISTAAANNNQ